MTTSTPTLERLLVYPIKSLDGTARAVGRIVDNGGFEWDRRYAIVDADGEYVNGKRERRIHRVRARYDLEAKTVFLRERGEEGDASGDEPETRFHLEDDRDALAAWLSSVVGSEVSLVRSDEGGFPDDTDASGPTVISTGTLEAVASWYDGISSEEMRRRLRPNLVIDAGGSEKGGDNGGIANGPETGSDPEAAFWEDRLYDRPERVVPFEIGSVAFHGVNPCQRCVVPTRDPDTGEPTENFRQRFVERRRATFPEWASRDWFDHYFRLMVNTRVPESSWGDRLAVGDRVTVSESIADPTA